MPLVVTSVMTKGILCYSDNEDIVNLLNTIDLYADIPSISYIFSIRIHSHHCIHRYVLQSLLDEYLNHYPDTQLFLRDDNGFATPELYEQTEPNGCSYAMRLKDNLLLRKNALHLREEVIALAAIHPEKFIALYVEFSYQEKSWNYSRHVICKIEKRSGELFYNSFTEAVIPY